MPQSDNSFISQLPEYSQSNQVHASNNRPQYWEQRYQENAAKWDIGMTAPPCASLLASDKALITRKTAVIGYGQGLDALNPE